MKHYFISVTAIILLMTNVSAFAETELQTEKQKFSYAVGIQIGNNLKQGGDIDIDALTQAIQDVFAGTQFKLSTQEMQEVMGRYREKQFEQRLEVAQTNKDKEKEFLAKNKTNDGIVETDSGLQYKILKQGDGEKPSPGAEVEVHYRGTLINGTEFDSSYKRGQSITLSLDNVIKGWQEALPMMPEGSKWQIYVPSELAYGERGAGNTIGPNEMLIFDIELLAIK